MVLNGIHETPSAAKLSLWQEDCDQPPRRVAPGIVAKSTCATQILVAQASPCRVASLADARIDIFSSVFNVPHSHSFPISPLQTARTDPARQFRQPSD